METVSMSSDESILIPNGYYPEDTIININTFAAITAGTATAGSILSGKTAWVNGQKITGTFVKPAGSIVVKTNELMGTISCTASTYDQVNEYTLSKSFNVGDLMYTKVTLNGNQYWNVCTVKKKNSAGVVLGLRPYFGLASVKLRGLNIVRYQVASGSSATFEIRRIILG